MKEPITIKGTILICDKCGCEFEFTEGPCICPGDEDGSQVEELALDDGWVKRGDKHYCPDCQEKNKVKMEIHFNDEKL